MDLESAINVYTYMLMIICECIVTMKMKACILFKTEL